jgi:hypothetical protein
MQAKKGRYRNFYQNAQNFILISQIFQIPYPFFTILQHNRSGAGLPIGKFRITKPAKRGTPNGFFGDFNRFWLFCTIASSF